MLVYSQGKQIKKKRYNKDLILIRLILKEFLYNTVNFLNQINVM